MKERYIALPMYGGRVDDSLVRDGYIYVGNTVEEVVELLKRDFLEWADGDEDATAEWMVYHIVEPAVWTLTAKMVVEAKLAGVDGLLGV